MNPRNRLIGLIAFALLAAGVAAVMTSRGTDTEGQTQAIQVVPDEILQNAAGDGATDTEGVSYVWWGPIGSLSVDDDSPDSPDYRYVIPPGAGEAIEAGQEIEIVPAVLEVRVGETIEIVNNDNQLHFVGPFTVGQGESLRQRFSEAGESIGTCSAHVLGSVRVVVANA